MPLHQEPNGQISFKWPVAYGLLLLAYLCLWTAVPVVAIPAAGHDDALFVRLATNLLRGLWLGPYDNLTLAKGPFYPIWIATVWLLGIPLFISQALLYAVACLILARGLKPWLGREYLALLIFAVLLFNPVMFGIAQLRVMREGIYAPMTVLLMAACIWWIRWQTASVLRRAALAFSMGVLLAAYWMTREEGLWIVPALLAALALAVVQPLAVAARRWMALRRELGLAALTIVTAWLGVFGIGTINRHFYGVADIVEFKQVEYLSAYGALSRIRHQNEWKPYVVIPREVLDRAYAVSPAAAELRPYFDGPGPVDFANVGCSFYHVQPCDNEIRAGWFMWTLRDAAALAGHHASAVEAQRFYRQLAGEIDAACTDGRLQCLAPRRAMEPPFRPDYIVPTLRNVSTLIRFMATLESIQIPRKPFSCGFDDCGQSPPLAAFLHMIRASTFVAAPGLALDGFSGRDDRQEVALLQAARSRIAANVLTLLVGLYSLALPLAAVTAMLAFAASVLMMARLRQIEPMAAVAAVAGVLTATRVGLLAYLDAVAIPSQNSLYASPAYPFLLLFCVASLLGFVRLALSWQVRVPKLGAAGSAAP